MRRPPSRYSETTRSGRAGVTLGAAVVLAALVALAALVVPSSAAAMPADESPFAGSWTEHQYEAADPLDSRVYWLYVPPTLPDGPVPLVVYLHGCNQNANEAALGVRWNETADAEGFVVVYPQQFNPNDAPPEEQADRHLFGGNGSRCWNWFRPDQITRDAGEPSTIAGITQTVIDQLDIDPERVYLSGISAGGVMASVMGATYPDLYAAVGVLAGCGYNACGDPDGSIAAAEMGEHARPLPIVIAHGTADTVAPYALGVDALEQWLGTNDLVDDGEANGSVPDQPASSVDVGLDDTVLNGVGTVGDICVRNSSVPCPGGLLGLAEYPHTIDTYVDANGCELLQFWAIHGLEHAYSGGDPRGTFVDPLGPGETPIAWQFFQRHTRSGPTAAACADGSPAGESGSAPAATGTSGEVTGGPATIVATGPGNSLALLLAAGGASMLLGLLSRHHGRSR